MRNTSRFAIAAVALLALSLPSFADAIVTVPGPLNSFSIDFRIDNTGPTDITSVVFDLTGTSLGLVIDTGPPAIFSTVAPAGGTISYGGNNPARTVFTTNFTGFGPGEYSQFAWDPDTAADPNFGAVVGDLAGTMVTVYFGGGGKTMGTLRDDGRGNLTTGPLSPVPEPSLLALLGIGAAASFGWRRRARRSAA